MGVLRGFFGVYSLHTGLDCLGIDLFVTFGLLFILFSPFIIYYCFKNYPKTSISFIVCLICGFWYNNYIEKLNRQSYEVLREKDNQYSSIDYDFDHCIDRIALCDARVKYCKEHLSHCEEHLKELKSYSYNDLDNEYAIKNYEYDIEKYQKDIKECSAEIDSLTNLIDGYLIQMKVNYKELVALYNNYNNEFDCHCEMPNYRNYYEMNRSEVDNLIKHNSDSIYEKNAFYWGTFM